MLISNPRYRRRNLIAGLIFLGTPLAVFLVVLLYELVRPDPEVMSSKQVLSPDKKTVAAAVVLYWGSYPGGIPSSAVRLQDAEHPKIKPVEILTFVQDSLYDCYVDPRWLDSTHLDVGYKGCGLDLKAVKAWGITISTHYITR